MSAPRFVDAVLCYVEGSFAYFTTQPLDQQWGDDWNYAPYEHNAGRPYEWRADAAKSTPVYHIVCVAFQGLYETPADIVNGNSRYSVEQINAGAIAWLAPAHYSSRPARPIRAGVTLREFYRLMSEGCGEVYVSLDVAEELLAPVSPPLAPAAPSGQEPK